VLLALLALLSACRREASPETAYRTFAAAARAGDATTVWSLLSEGSRARLDERARALAARAPGVHGSGRDLVLGGLSAGAPRLARVALVRASGDRAVLAIVEEGAAAPAEVAMLREGGRWRVVLPGAERSR
jgi:hypothetical protein